MFMLNKNKKNAKQKKIMVSEAQGFCNQFVKNLVKMKVLMKVNKDWVSRIKSFIGAVNERGKKRLNRFKPVMSISR